MMITMRPGSTTVTAGTATCASTLATATAVPGFKPGPGRSLRGQAAGLLAQLGDLAGHLVVDEALQPGIKRPVEGVGRESLALGPDALVAGGGQVARLFAGELPDHPVGALDQPAGGGVHRRVLVEDLPGLGHEPLRADLAAVAVQEIEALFACDLVELVGLRLGGMVLPQVDPGVGMAAPLGQRAQRRAIGQGGHHRAGGEVDAETDHVLRIDAALRQYGRDGALEDLDVVIGVLQRKIRLQADVGARQPFVDHAVGVGMDGGGYLAAVGHIDQHRASRFSAKVHSDCVFCHVFSPMPLS